MWHLHNKPWEPEWWVSNSCILYNIAILGCATKWEWVAAPEGEPVGEGVLEAQQLGSAVYQGHHVARKAGLQACMLVQVGQYDLHRTPQTSRPTSMGLVEAGQNDLRMTPQTLSNFETHIGGANGGWPE